MPISWKKIALLVATISWATGLTGCAARRAEAVAKRPVADTVCVEISGVSEPELALLLRKARNYLQERGFRTVERACDVDLKYVALDSGKWEVLTASAMGLRSQTRYRAEGVLTVSSSGKVLEEDQSIDERGYSTKLDLLDGLAWAIVKYIPDNYRPQSPRPK